MSLRKRLLIVDDNVELAENIKEIVDDEGIDAIVAESGSHALELLCAVEFDLMITDMRMPGMNGLEVIRYVKRRWPALPVAIMTAYARDELLDQAQREGALGVISKPFDFTELTAFVRRVATATAPILIVEDDPDLRSNLIEIVQELPQVVPYAAANLDAARRLAGNVQFRGAVIDLRLPDGDGLEFGEAIRAEQAGQLSVVYVTGYYEDYRDSLEQLLARPGMRLLSKPFTASQLVSLVRETI